LYAAPARDVTGLEVLGIFFHEAKKIFLGTPKYEIIDSERRDECIDFTMMCVILLFKINKFIIIIKSHERYGDPKMVGPWAAAPSAHPFHRH